jgi:hypothetical protein
MEFLGRVRKKGTPIAGGERGDHGVGFAVQVKYMLL